jgi:hypothetical protein
MISDSAAARRADAAKKAGLPEERMWRKYEHLPVGLHDKGEELACGRDSSSDKSKKLLSHAFPGGGGGSTPLGALREAVGFSLLPEVHEAYASTKKAGDTLFRWLTSAYEWQLLLLERAVSKGLLTPDTWVLLDGVGRDRLGVASPQWPAAAADHLLAQGIEFPARCMTEVRFRCCEF